MPPATRAAIGDSVQTRVRGAILHAMRAHEQQHFDNISQHYQKSAESWEMIYEQAGQQLDPLVRNCLVVDVGNGGRFAYDTSLPARVIAVDVAPQMMDAITDPRIQKIVDDARDLNKFPDGSIDVLVFSLVMHHINGANLAESRATLDQILTSAQRKLKPGGQLVILEALLNPALYSLQCMLFPLTRFVLGTKGVSMIFFYRLSLLRAAIVRRFQIEPGDIVVSPLKVTGWIDPLGGSFPGRIKIPAVVQPWRFTLLLATRPETAGSETLRVANAQA